MHEPLEIVGVDVDGVGMPRNDGTRGSALYMVPIRLSRAPSPREAELLIANFDRPSSWSMMHRPGIARVSGDRLLLDGTTVEEVKDYHAKTVRLAVEATNIQESESRRRETAAASEATIREEQHRGNVANVVGEIDFT